MSAFTSKVQTTGNWNDGATWLKATASSLTVTVTVAGGNVTFTRSSGDWTTNVSVNARSEERRVGKECRL